MRKKFIGEYDKDIPSNLTAEEILIRSGNIGSVRIGQKIGVDNYSSFLKKLGLLDKINFDIEEVAQPLPIKWGKCKLATSSFGHGVTTTLLQLAKAYSIISNGGFETTVWNGSSYSDIEYLSVGGSYLNSYGVELSRENGKQLFVPSGFAHGFAVTSDYARVIYKVNKPYMPNFERGFGPFDPQFNLKWPFSKKDAILSDKDLNWPLFKKNVKL